MLRKNNRGMIKADRDNVHIATDLLSLDRNILNELDNCKLCYYYPRDQKLQEISESKKYMTSRELYREILTLIK